MNNIENNQTTANKIEYAGFGIRFVALIIDVFATFPIGILVLYNLFTIKSFPLMIFTTILTALYRPLMEWRFGATLGKMALKLNVLNEFQEHITLDQAFGRNIPWIINYTLSLFTYYYLFQTEDFLAMDSIFNLKALAQPSPIETANTAYFYIFIAIMLSLNYSKKKQGIHDKIARTFVAKINK